MRLNLEKTEDNTNKKINKINNDNNIKENIKFKRLSCQCLETHPNNFLVSYYIFQDKCFHSRSKN